MAIGVVTGQLISLLLTFLQVAKPAFQRLRRGLEITRTLVITSRANRSLRMENYTQNAIIKTKLIVNISWVIPWLAGWMFTVAYCGGVDKILPLGEKVSFIMTVVRVVFIYFLWPYFLGTRLAR